MKREVLKYKYFKPFPQNKVIWEYVTNFIWQPPILERMNLHRLTLACAIIIIIFKLPSKLGMNQQGLLFKTLNLPLNYPYRVVGVEFFYLKKHPPCCCVGFPHGQSVYFLSVKIQKGEGWNSGTFGIVPLNKYILIL